MKWMERMFRRIIDGEPPSLVDLPTGAGKTELVVIWLIALAWYAKNRETTKAMPRRLVWVVNRRVLVQQVFNLARELRRKLADTAEVKLDEMRRSLALLSGGGTEVFKVAELRGQIMADRDWAISPATPLLIIGTVDQIGSRLLFQGYGLGKWGRPQQAGLLGVDTWVAVDEAHLVPAFVLTLRQLRGYCAAPTAKLPAPFDSVFSRLPFWHTELSATPGLPHPSVDKPFSLTDEEKNDPIIEDRILASDKRQVLVEFLPPGKKATEIKEALVQKLIRGAVCSKAQRIAVFVSEVGVADKVASGIKAALKIANINEDRLCKVTGRIRGYERDRLAEQKAFQVFLAPREDAACEAGTDSWYLVGTAAAEVGLDADADAIFCDFASLPTLLQRLGRLDRRGFLSRRHADGKGEEPTMVIFAQRSETEAKVREKLTALASALKTDNEPFSPELMAGAHWLNAVKAKDEKAGDDAKEGKSAKDLTAPLIDAATWNVLSPADGVCSPKKNWLADENARIASGPVVVPPLTDTVLDYWSATTDARSPHLSPHPFLYGLADDDEGTPLIGVAFRLEVEALRETADDEDNTEATDAVADVVEILKRFPLLRAELHQMKLSTVRDWLTSPEAEKHPLVYRARDQWHAKPAGEPATSAAAALGPNGTLILPASVLMREPCKKLLEDCEQIGGKDTPISDVLDGVSDRQRARYLRTIEPPEGCSGDDGAWRWDAEEHDKTSPVATKPDGFRQSLRKELRIGGTDYVFRYFRPHQNNQQLQYLDDNEGIPGHITRAECEAARIAETIAPGDSFLRTLLATAAHFHDEGKRFSKWQRAFGRPAGKPEVAKLAPGLERPAPLHGFRHEWESLRQLSQKGAQPPPEILAEAHELWHDLLLHLVGVHHGHLRPSITDDGLIPTTEASKQNRLRLEAAERFARLQRQLGHWRLAYLEALLKTADAEGSRVIPEDEDEDDGN